MSYGIPSNERQEFPIVEETSKGLVTIEDMQTTRPKTEILM